MSAENNPRVRAMAKALKTANASLARGESLQVVFIELYFQGATDALDIFEQSQKAQTRKGKRK